jgi:FkbH-like protein
MNPLYTELQWLPRAPDHFVTKLKSLGCENSSLGQRFQEIALHALDLYQLSELASVIGNARSEGKSLEPLVPFRLAVLSNSTTDLILPSLIASAARHGIALDIIRPEYGQVAQEVLTNISRVITASPDAILLAIDYRALPLTACPGDVEMSRVSVERAVDYIQTLRAGIRTNSKATCIIQTIPPPPETLFGNLDCSVEGTLRNMISKVNWELIRLVSGETDVLFDVAGLAETVGLADWHNPKLWNMAKLAFSDALIPLYADHVARTIASVLGKSRKALVLDLDNTIWGGVIGDDGLAGIQIAQGDARGEAHLAVQRLALELRKRGIVLAVCSKNIRQVALEPFEKHEDMLLRLEDVAAFQINFDDKATNIRRIADDLSLGLDSIVFLDDNPVERGLVRKLLPQVAVPELPQDPAWYARTLAAAGYFETVGIASEDIKRVQFYQDNSKRENLQFRVGSVDEYLESLGMVITFQPFDPTGRCRIAQLINKTTQYNLTGRRYTESEVVEAERDPRVFTLQTRLADTFGDNGMISVVVCRETQSTAWEIDTWLMSCRVLGRRVEYLVLYEILKHANAAGVRRLLGTYRPTERNAPAADHYLKLGFTLARKDDMGASYWELIIGQIRYQNIPARVISQGFASNKDQPFANRIPRSHLINMF